MSEKTTNSKSPITVVDWISYSEAEDLESSIGGLGGFFMDGMRGNKDYFDALHEHVKPYAEAIRTSVIKYDVRHTGEDHQGGPDGVPLFSDGTVGTFSWRAWGDLMAAIWSEEEDKDYCYMNFYM